MSALASPQTAAATLQTLIRQLLAPRVTAIDLEGEYPEDFLRALGPAGALGGVIAPEHGGTGAGLQDTLATMTRIGEHCLSTAFAYWCHAACARYIQVSDNAAARRELLPGLADGTRMGGTGLSNTLKSCHEVERFLLTARRVDHGYEIDGTLPWVSNLGASHVFVTGCPVEGDGRLVFFVVQCDQPGFELRRSAQFTALEGTRTFSCHFKGVRIDDRHVLAQPDASADYALRIQPGMILSQMGMGLGLVRDCIRLVGQMARTHAHVNVYETEQAEDLRRALDAAEAETFRLAARLDAGVPPAQREAVLTEVLRLRLAGGELSLRAAQAAMLHQGARGYLRGAAAQRRLREAYFVAIVTPSLKHLRMLLACRGAGH